MLAHRAGGPSPAAGLPTRGSLSTTPTTIAATIGATILAHTREGRDHLIALTTGGFQSRAARNALRFEWPISKAAIARSVAGEREQAEAIDFLGRLNEQPDAQTAESLLQVLESRQAAMRLEAALTLASDPKFASLVGPDTRRLIDSTGESDSAELWRESSHRAAGDLGPARRGEHPRVGDGAIWMATVFVPSATFAWLLITRERTG